MKRETVNVTNIAELEQIILDTYGRPYNIMGNELWLLEKNVVIEDIGGEVNTYDCEKLQKWVDGKKCLFTLKAILKDLHYRGVIKAGTYIVET